MSPRFVSLSSFRRRLRRLRADRRGIAAVEFAMIAPILIVTYLGVLEVSQGFQASRKLSMLARTAADLASQGPKDPAPATNPIPVSEMNDINAASQWVMAPFPMATGQARLTISGVVFKLVSSQVRAYTDWSVTWGGSRRPCTQLTLVANSASPSLTTMPTGLAQAGTTVIVADASYDYKPLLGGNFQTFGGGSKSAITLNQTAYMRPRNTTRVSIASGLAGSQICSVTFP